MLKLKYALHNLKLPLHNSAPVLQDQARPTILPRLSEKVAKPWGVNKATDRTVSQAVPVPRFRSFDGNFDTVHKM